jgi:hypothetical protein
MLLLGAIAHLVPAPTQHPDQALLQSNAALGHLGLTLIALVYVLVIVWQG